MACINLYCRLVDLTQRLAAPEAAGASSAAIDRAAKEVKEFISVKYVSNKWLPGLGIDVLYSVIDPTAAILTNQVYTGHAMQQVSDAVGSSLDKVDRDLSKQMQAFERARESDLQANLKTQNSLDALQSDLQALQLSHHKLSRCLEERMQTDAESQGHATTMRQDLQDKLDKREERVAELEKQLQHLTEKYSADMKALADKMADSTRCKESQDSQDALRGVLSELQQTLAQGFRAAKEGSEHSLRQTETAMAALEGQLKAVNNQLAANICASQEDKTGQAAQADNSEVLRLREKIDDLERQAATADSLRERWEKDLRTIHTLRSQLGSIKERVPQARNLGTTIDKIAEINEILHATSNYLHGEREWVREHRNEAVIAVVSGAAGCEQAQAPHPTPAPAGSADTQPGVTKPRPNVIMGDIAFLEHRGRRKVHLNTSMVLPDDPPSIEQEQLRRREAMKPRPILKASSSRESANGGGGQAFQAVAQDGGEPAEDKASSGSAQRVVQGIRDRFVCDATNLTRLVDIQEGLLPSLSTGADADGKKHGLDITCQAPEITTKRAKISSETPAKQW